MRPRHVIERDAKISEVNYVVRQLDICPLCDGYRMGFDCGTSIKLNRHCDKTGLSIHLAGTCELFAPSRHYHEIAELAETEKMFRQMYDGGD
ncbi:MAG: hypothetical protein LBC70_03255 [Chitinispirillales bacterium]|jgi:hypothetical protein|nr:hypothetical protein [Chitinispirillales bacterium]